MVIQSKAAFLDSKGLAAVLRGVAVVIPHGAEGQHKHIHMGRSMCERHTDGQRRPGGRLCTSSGRE